MSRRTKQVSDFNLWLVFDVAGVSVSAQNRSSGFVTMVL